MQITIHKNSLQRDSLNPPDEADGEIVFWKRVKAEGKAMEGKASSTFEIILDLRARLFQVRCDGNIPASVIAEAVTNEMASYTLLPRRQLLVQRSATPVAAEWIAHDAEHVSGLLHRLREAKAFEARETPPQPPGLEKLRNALLDSMHDNMLSMRAWRKRRDSPHQLMLLKSFDVYTWDTLRSDFLRLCDDQDLQLAFAKFFDACGRFAAATAAELQQPRQDPNRLGPDSIVQRDMDEMIQVGQKTLMKFGRELVLPQHLRD